MSDPNNPNVHQRTTPQWGLYQRELFWAPNEGRHPPFNTDPGKLRALAEQRLSEGGWYYTSSNTGLSWTHYANRQAFYRHQIVPRVLVDTQSRDTATTIFGHRVSAPIGFAPIGINRICHAMGELSPARVAGELNLPYCLSSAGSYSIEAVAEANDALASSVTGARGDIEKNKKSNRQEERGVPFYQLYWSPDDNVTLSMLERAARNGYTALFLTTDTWQLGWRHDDVANGNYAFYHEHGAGDLGLQDKAFEKQLKGLGLDAQKEPKKDRLPWLMDNWRRISGGKPFVLKGLQSVADARKAVQMGVDGIVVSNHAVRQVDGAIGSLDALEKMNDAVGDKTYVMFDSGIRGGADVFKALALGAKFVFIGRLWVYGLGSCGEEGVRHVVKSLLADFNILINVAGYPDLKEINRDAIDSMPKGAYFPSSQDMAWSVFGGG
ncbi:FMN-dependent dehydrogenase [Xylaria arbuscula]|nr:FMN-dependent dehydrogenase [Xylaria arbuscula]